MLIIVFAVLTLIVMFMFTYGKRVQMDRLSILHDCKDWVEFDKVADKSVTAFCKREYDILIDGATNHIPQLEKEIKESEGQKKYVLAYLL